jgi:hypothetical protein
MGLDLERRELVAAHVRARPRHGDGGIPAQDREYAPERVKPPEFLLELLVRGRRRHVQFYQRTPSLKGISSQ